MFWVAASRSQTTATASTTSEPTMIKLSRASNGLASLSYGILLRRQIPFHKATLAFLASAGRISMSQSLSVTHFGK